MWHKFNVKLDIVGILVFICIRKKNNIYEQMPTKPATAESPNAIHVWRVCPYPFNPYDWIVFTDPVIKIKKTRSSQIYRPTRCRVIVLATGCVGKATHVWLGKLRSGPQRNSSSPHPTKCSIQCVQTSSLKMHTAFSWSSADDSMIPAPVFISFCTKGARWNLHEYNVSCCPICLHIRCSSPQSGYFVCGS